MESPIILPPESISNSLITRDTFTLSKTFAVTLQLSSNNIRVVTTEIENDDGSISTTVTTEPDTDKELAFSIFLTDEDDPYTFGASAGRCGWSDYSTKGEIGEGIMLSNGKKFQVNYGENQNIDFLLDHIYPENEQFLVKNQTHNIKSIFSMVFVTHKEFFNTVIDKYGNSYYDKIAVDSAGNVIDFLTGETRPLSEYNSPVLIQYKTTAGDDKCFIFDFEFEGQPVNIINMNYLTFRILFENYGGVITMEIMKPGENFFRHCMSKDLGYNFSGNNNIRFGFGQFTPLFSYDKNKIANFNCHSIQMQQSNENPKWLKSLAKEIKTILGATKFNIELTNENNELPAELTQVDYIENYTKALINSGIILNSEYSIAGEYEITTEDYYGCFFGSYSTSDPGYRIWSSYGSNKQVKFDYGTSYKLAATDVSMVGKRIKVNSDKNKIIFDIINDDKQLIMSNPEQIFECPHSAIIFASHPHTTNEATVKLYSLSGSINGVKQFNFIPIVSNSGRPGLFDAVSGQSIYCTNFDAKIGRDFLWGSNKVKNWFDLLSKTLTHYFGKNTVKLVLEEDYNMVAAIMPDSATDSQITHAKRLLNSAVPKKYVTETRWKENIPTEYTPLEYLECLGGDGKQYINTELYATQETRVFTTSECTSTSAGTLSFVYGAEGNVNAPVPMALAHYLGSNGTKSTLRYFWNNKATIKANVVDGRKLSVDYSKNGLYVNGQLKATVPNAEFRSDYPISVFSSVLGSSWAFYGRIYELKIWESEVLMLSFIPALDPTGKPCMFDTVTRKPFHNKATTKHDFIAGMTTAQVRNLASLPAPGDVNTLSISIPYEVYNDSEAWSVIEAAQQKGWTFTFYWTDIVDYFTPKINAIVGAGNYTISYNFAAQKLSLAFAAVSVTNEQIAEIESLLTPMLPPNLEMEIAEMPMNYSRLEYIENPGNAYIVPELTMSSEYAIDADFVNLDNRTNQHALICARGLVYPLYALGVWDGHQVMFLYGNEGRINTPIGADTIGLRWTYTLRKDSLSVSVPELNLNKTFAYDYESFVVDRPTYLFCLVPRTNVDDEENDWDFRCRLFSLRGSENGVPKFDFIPAYDKKTKGPCLFDKVSRKVYYSADVEADFTYPGAPTQSTTYSLRRPTMYAQYTEHGIRRLYGVPEDYEGTMDEYAAENGFKELVIPPMPETGHWIPEWHETDTQLILDWVETEAAT